MSSSRPPREGLPRERTRRDQAMANMVSAATELLRERPPEAVTVRQVAERAGHHHRFVAAWFGGKAGLILAAFERLVDDVTSAVQLPGTRTALSEEVVRAVRMMNWLVADNPAVFASRQRATPLIERITEIYVDAVGLDRQIARLAAQRAMAGAIAIVLFPEPLGIGPDDIGRHLEFEMRVAHLLQESTGSARSSGSAGSPGSALSDSGGERGEYLDSPPEAIETDDEDDNSD